jgi:formamidopyrimidine-DNA glycosylase
MPESPEVQELVRFLGDHASGRRVASVDIVLPKALKTTQPPPAALVGRRIGAVTRRGKMIDIAMGGDADDAEGDALHLVVHFGHDGWVLWNPIAPADRARAGEATLMARIRLEGADDAPGFDLTDAGEWKSLTLHVVGRPEDVPAIAKLGPDPLAGDVDLPAFTAIVAGRRKQIKALLQDQTALAGIGNAYSDEILHAAKISPVVHAATLTPPEVGRLHAAMLSVLKGAVDARRGVAPADLRAAKHAALRVHRKAGWACPVCGDEIRSFTFSGAAAQYCPTCQTGGAVLG